VARVKRPLSIVQQAMLYADQLRPGILSEDTTLSIVLKVCGPLDLDRLAMAYDQLVSRHEILRTLLVPASAHREPYAEVEPHRRTWPELVQDPLDDDALFAHWDALAVHPQRPPLMRCLIARRAPEEHLVGLVFSHLVADPTGLRIAARELADLYTGATLPPPVQYGDYARWEAERHVRHGAQDRAAWERILAGCRPARYQRQVRFVVGRKPAPVTDFVRVFSKQESDALTAWSWRNRSTLSITLLAAFARAIRDDADRDDLVVSTVFERRDHPAAARLLGIFLHAVPIRLRVDERASMPELVARARSAVLEAHKRSTLPPLDFMRLMPRFLPGLAGLEPTWMRLFQYVPMTPGAYRFGDARATIAHLGGRGDPEALFGVHVGAFHAEDGSLHVRFNYDRHELDDANARRILDDFRAYALEVVG
jgi:hypothetical protein